MTRLGVGSVRFIAGVLVAFGLVAAGCGTDAIETPAAPTTEGPGLTFTPSSGAESTAAPLVVDSEVPPPNTLFELDWSETWNTSEKRPSLAEEASPALIPVAGGPVGQEAAITFRATSSGGQLGVDLVVRWDDSDPGIASLQITRATAEESLVCDDIRDGGSYTSMMILSESVEGCGFTNEVGGFFLRWNANGDSYLFQSGSLSQQQALDYLESWQPI